MPVGLTVAGGHARVALGAGDKVAGRVLLIGFDRRHTDKVGGGENDGRTLTHVDVVRGFAEIGRFDGTAATIEAKVPWSSDRVAAIVQAKDGRILGVAVADAVPAS